MKQVLMGTLAALTLVSAFAQAGPIVEGLEWRQVTETTNLAWTEIATVCDSATGACAGSLGVVDFDGWVWAGVSEIGDMFRAVTGYPVSDPSTVTHGSSSWAPGFFELFDPTYAGGDVVAVHGLSRDATEYSAARPYVVDRLGTGSDWISTAVSATMHDPYPSVGAWLYRAAGPAPVTEPGPLPLLLLGTALIWAARHRRGPGSPC